MIRHSVLIAVLLTFAAGEAWSRPKRSLDSLLSSLRGGAEKARKRAARELGKRRAQRAVGPLVAALELDRSAAVRTSVAWALGACGGSRAVRGLIGALKQERNTGVRNMLVWALGRLADRSAIGVLISAFRDDRNAGVRIQAGRALANFKDRRVRRAYLGTLRSRVPALRTLAIKGLQRFGMPLGEIRKQLPESASNSLLVAEKKSEGLGFLYGFLPVNGLGLIYAKKTALGVILLSLQAAGMGMIFGTAFNDAFAAHPDNSFMDKYPVRKSLFYVGLVLTIGSYLADVIGTPIAVASYNSKIEARRRAVRVMPYFNLMADRKVFGLSFGF